MKSYVNLSLVSIFLCFTGCATTDNAVSLNLPTTQYKVVQTKNENIKAKSIKKKITQQKPKTRKPKPTINKPLEIERVCFDKDGKAHNCNYKIPKPY